MNWFLIAGLLLNCALIVINRFVCKLPNKVQLPLLIAGIGLMIVGLVQISI